VEWCKIGARTNVILRCDAHATRHGLQATARRKRRARNGRKRSFEELYILTRPKVNPDNTRSATLNAFPRASHHMALIGRFQP